MARRTRRLSFLRSYSASCCPRRRTRRRNPDPRDRVLPNFDIRLQAPRVAPALDAEAQKQLEELRAIVRPAHTAARQRAGSPRHHADAGR
jgi:hypothetical protein